MDDQLAGATSLLFERFSDLPPLAVVLGSGYRAVLPRVKVVASVGLGELPGGLIPTVPGHEGAAIVLAEVAGQRVILVTGRLHYYEGHEMEAITLPVRALAAAGVRSVLLTNAAGGIREGMGVGDLMCVSDHLNLTGVNPLRGSLGAGGKGFVDLNGLYSDRMNRVIKRSAAAHGFAMHEGVYVGVSGPSFETPAEIRMFARLGGDAVGMSLIPESIAARQAGLEVGGLSFITNLAAGRNEGPIEHVEVLQTLNQAGDRLGRVLTDFAVAWSSDSD